MTTTNSPVTVVTGANSGIGRAVAIHLASLGHNVFGTVRSVDKARKLNAMSAEAGVKVTLIELDLADDDSVAVGFDRILSEVGHVDVLINNAGVGGNGVVEETPLSSYREVMNVNFYGPLRCLKAVLPGMRARRQGTIVNITSIVGRIAALAQAPYVASKWALEGVSEELAQEVAALGIRVVIVEPGVTKSAIFAKNAQSTETSSDYEPHLRRMSQFYAAGYASASDPVEVATVIEQAIATDQPRLRYTMSWGGPEILSARRQMTDEQWVELGRISEDEEYYRTFSKAFGVDITL